MANKNRRDFIKASASMGLALAASAGKAAQAKGSSKIFASNGVENWIDVSSDDTISLETPGEFIDLGKAVPKQTIEGFGGAFNERGWDALSVLQQPARADVLDALFSSEGLGLTMGRAPMGASDYAMDAYSYAETPGDYELNDFTITRDRRYLLPYIKAAQAVRPDLKFFASPWSPPVWMKANNHYACEGMKADAHLIFDDRTQKAYGLYFTKYVQAYAAEGIKIEQVHLQNEPAASQIFPSCLWTGVQMRDFLRDYMIPAFDKANLNTELWLGTVNHADVEAYAVPVFEDPILRQRLSGIGYQWDGKKAIAKTHARYPKIRLMQTESECGDGKNTISYGFYVCELMQTYFEGGANAYIYWNMVLDSGGLSTWGWPQNSMITVDRYGAKAYKTFEYFVMKHASHLVRPGASFLDTGSKKGVMAFLNLDGSSVVIVANSQDTKRDITIDLHGNRIHRRLKAQTLYSFIFAA